MYKFSWVYKRPYNHDRDSRLVEFDIIRPTFMSEANSIRESLVHSLPMPCSQMEYPRDCVGALKHYPRTLSSTSSTPDQNTVIDNGTLPDYR